MTGPAPWTADDLDRLRAMDESGTSPEAMAERLGRTVDDIEDRLRILHARAPLNAFGPDEEGDVAFSEEADVDDPAAWVHIDHSHDTPPAPTTLPPPD